MKRKNQQLDLLQGELRKLKLNVPRDEAVRAPLPHTAGAGRLPTQH